MPRFFAPLFPIIPRHHLPYFDTENAGSSDGHRSDYATRTAFPSYRTRGKKPLQSWQIFQTERADTALIRGWWSHQPQANVGVVTGALSGLIVLDIDGDAGRDALRHFLRDQAIHEFPLTPTVKTGHGWHYYFAYPGAPMANATAWHGLTGVDIRADGGYVVALPSIHPNGRAYEWVASRSWLFLPIPPKR